MDENGERFYAALASRDARFDGTFFTGVTTTGIYCRPVCPAPTPRRKNVEFFACAAAAERAGFRPCRRCRPETAPGTPAWTGTSVTVSRALRLISEGALNDASVDDLADRLGVGGRHLRRLFDRHLGASPVAIAQSRRIHFARKLLDETDLPMREVAYAAGFQSIKRFNTVIRSTFGRTPTELRKKTRSAPVPPKDGCVILKLPYRAPYDWDAMLDYLGERATPGVEQVVDGMYRRSAFLDDRPTFIEVRNEPKESRIHLWISRAVRRDLMDAVERVRRVFDLGADPMQIAQHLRRDPRLRRSVQRRPGIRVPGAWDPFELSVRAILGQQVSVKGATTLAGRLAEAFGRPIDSGGPDGPTHLFPEAAALADADIRAVGLPRSRAAAIRELARRVRDGELPLSWGECAVETHEGLVSIPGVGEWTAQYVAMRGLGQPDMFLPGDLGVRKALADNGKLPTPRQAAAVAETWRPWRAYGVLHLWMGGESGRARGAGRSRATARNGRGKSR
jgi:AraC family transcriptional regulator of adaptative response / DNA-3-methyladenine glycosylase II